MLVVLCGWLGHWWVGYSCRLRGPKSVHSGNGRSLLALRHLSLPVSTPLRVVNRCWSGFPCNWWYINVETFNFNLFNARQHICYSALYAIACPSGRLSVCLSVTRVDQSKTVEVRITQPSPQSSPMTLVS